MQASRVQLRVPPYNWLLSSNWYHDFFFCQGFLHRHWQFTGQQGKGRNHLLFHSTTSIPAQTLRHLFATLPVRWLSRIFNRNACVCQTATWWDLPPYRMVSWMFSFTSCLVRFFTSFLTLFITFYISHISLFVLKKLVHFLMLLV